MERLRHLRQCAKCGTQNASDGLLHELRRVPALGPDRVHARGPGRARPQAPPRPRRAAGLPAAPPPPPGHAPRSRGRRHPAAAAGACRRGRRRRRRSPWPRSAVRDHAAAAERGGDGGRRRWRSSRAGRCMLVALVRNQSGIVDNYDLALEGLPAGVVEHLADDGLPGALRLGAAALTSRRSTIELKPPRAPEAEARPWQFQLVARSRARAARGSARAAGHHDDRSPFIELQTDIRPAEGLRAGARRRSRSRSRTRPTRRSTSTCTAHDSEDALPLRASTRRRTAPPRAGARGTKFTVSPPKQRWFGRPSTCASRSPPQAVGEQPATSPCGRPSCTRPGCHAGSPRHPDRAGDGGRRVPGLEEPAGAATRSRCPTCARSPRARTACPRPCARPSSSSARSRRRSPRTSAPAS